MKIKNLKLKISGMHCSSCAMNIDFDLEDLDGITSAKTSYAKEVCEVDFDEEKVKVEDIISSVEKTVYKASPSL